MSCLLQDRKTLLHVAAERGHTEVVDVLVKHDSYMHMYRPDKVSDL